MKINIKNITITAGAVTAILAALGKYYSKLRKRYCLNDMELISLCKKSRKRTLTPEEREEICNKVLVMLDAGVNVNSIDGRGRTALMLASSGGNDNLDLVKLLLNRQPKFLRWLRKINAKSHCGNTAFILASRFGSSKIVETLIKAGADVNAKNNKDWTALRRAEKHGYTETARILRHYGAV